MHSTTRPGRVPAPYPPRTGPRGAVGTLYGSEDYGVGTRRLLGLRVFFGAPIGVEKNPNFFAPNKMSQTNKDLVFYIVCSKYIVPNFSPICDQNRWYACRKVDRRL